MWDDDLEKTRALNELNELNTEKSNNVNNEETIDKEVDETEFGIEEKEALFNDLTREEQVITDEQKEDKEEEKSKKKKESIIDKFKKLPKKNKIIIISGIILIILLIVGLIIFLVTSKKKEDKKEELPSVVLAKDNYKYQNGILTILDDNDNTIGTYECNNKDENKCYVAYVSNDEDTFNVAKNVYEDGSVVKQRSQSILNRYVFIYDNSGDSNNIKLYDMLNNKVLSEYLSVKQYDVETKNLAVLKNTDNKYGIIKFDEESQATIMDFVYDYIGIINKEKDNLIVVKNSKGYYLADYSNNLKTRAFSGEIVDYNDNYVVVKQSNSKYIVYNFTGEEFNKDYDYISLINDNYVAVVNENKLYIRDYSDNKYNEEGIELTNSDYSPIYTFDNKNKLLSESYAYKFELHDFTLTAKVQNSDKTSRDEIINLKDGDISSKYKYYSYLNNKLFFYSDEEKKTIIGTYECKNKNTSTGETFNNCYVANNTSFNDSYINPNKNNTSIIPVYNNRFVFIYDNSELTSDENKEIKFYDFKENKSLGTYNQIDSDVDANIQELTFKETNYSAIIAKLKSGKYGLIEIDTNGASVNQNFKFNHDYIERANKDYIVKLSSGKWQIVYEGGQYSSAEFPGKIMNYANSFVVVKIDDKVYLYNGDGSEFSKVKDAFDYIDISNKYAFGAVSNNKLRIYDYQGKLLNKDDITLSTIKGFKLNANESEVEVKIYDKDNKVSQTIKYNLNENDKKEDKEVDDKNEE